MHDDEDWMQRLRNTADRLREAADSSQPPPKLIKRPYATPSGASARSVKAKNAQLRIQQKRAGGR